MDTKWLNRVPDVVLRDVLIEYRYLVRRFPQWIALTIGRSDDNTVRRLLIPNLVEECGTQNTPSHLEMLDNCLTSCGIVLGEEHEPLKTTAAFEAWFYSVFATESTYASLCVLGPGTEAISQKFLGPLEASLRNTLGTGNIDFSYFEAHRTPLEEQHARSIQAAMHNLENIEGQSTAVRDAWIRAAIDAHANFWTSLKSQLMRRHEQASYSVQRSDHRVGSGQQNVKVVSARLVENSTSVHTSRS